MTRRELLLGACAAPLLASGLAGKRPNIVLVMTDDQGYGDLGINGNPVVKTPNIDALGRESVRFVDFHVSPTCAPTRSSLMSGKHEFKNGVTHTIFERERMSLKTTTIAQVLQRAGYATGIFGKWHLGDAQEYQPNRRGFEEMFIHGCGGIGQKYAGTCADAPGNSYFNPVLNHNGKLVKTEGYCTDVFFRQAMEWIGEKRQKPFFAYITPNAPHAPLDCPDEYWKPYADKVPEPAARFFGMITNIDDNVGKLRAMLKQKNLDRHTLFIFMTDNGGTAGVKVFNAGMRSNKGSAYNGGTRVPLFMHWPAVLEAREETHLAAHIDLFPTLAAIAKAKIPDGAKLDGYSLLPLLESASAPWPDRLLFTHVGRWEKGKAAEAKYDKCSVRSARYNMVNSTPVKKWELYDLKSDPSESKDIAAEHPSIVREYEIAYENWWAEVFPLLENENAVPPAVPPYFEKYKSQSWWE